MSDTGGSVPTDTNGPAASKADLATLARGGRINFMGFVIRLIARLPFLFIGGQIYGAAALGRFAYAVLIVELAAQLASLGLKRGLAQQLAGDGRPHSHIVADAMLTALFGSLVGMMILGSFPQAMFPNSEVHGQEWLLPITVLAIAWTDIALAALAYHNNVGATVRARSIVEPWTISIVAFAWSYWSLRDGLIIAYVISMLAALVAALIPLAREFGIPSGWRPNLGLTWRTARRNTPLAAADAVEWGSRRIDIAVLGLFLGPQFVGVYYVAQQVASLPAKLKTSFEPVLGPVIARNLAVGDLAAVGAQVRQVDFWILAAQAGIALSLALPGHAVMALVGSDFTIGTATLGFLLAAEVIAATAVVSEAALIYLARHKNMGISLTMLALQAALSAAFIIAMRAVGWPEAWQATGPAAALCVALGFASIAKSRLLSRTIGAPVSGWRWALVLAILAGVAVGIPVRLFFPPGLQLVIGIPLIFGTFGYVIWTRGFGREDRELFKMRKADVENLAASAEADKFIV